MSYEETNNSISVTSECLQDIHAQSYLLSNINYENIDLKNCHTQNETKVYYVNRTEFSLQGGLEIESREIIQKIYLETFPIDVKYTLSLDGIDVMIAKYDSQMQCPVFDFSESDSVYLSIWKGINKSLNENKDAFIDASKIDCIRINFKKLNTDKQDEFRFKLVCLRNNLNHEELRYFYPNRTYTVNLSECRGGETKSLSLFNTNIPCKVIIRGKDYGLKLLPSTDGNINKLFFKRNLYTDTPSEYNDLELLYLTQNQMENSIYNCRIQLVFESEVTTGFYICQHFV